MALLVLNTSVAEAKGKPAKAGKTLAQITACNIAGKLTGSQKDRANIAVIKKHKIAEKSEIWKAIMNNAKKEEFRRLDDTNPLELGIMCGIIMDKYL